MSTPSPSPCHLVEIVSRRGFEATVGSLEKAIREAGLLLLARIDHAAGATAAGFEMPPTLVLFYGHHMGGTPVMLSVPSAALELPLKVLVREVSPDMTIASFHPVASTLDRLGVPPELVRPLERAQDLLRNALRD